MYEWGCTDCSYALIPEGNVSKLRYSSQNREGLHRLALIERKASPLATEALAKVLQSIKGELAVKAGKPVS